MQNKRLSSTSNKGKENLELSWKLDEEQYVYAILLKIFIIFYFIKDLLCSNY